MSGERKKEETEEKLTAGLKKDLAENDIIIVASGQTVVRFRLSTGIAVESTDPECLREALATVAVALQNHLKAAEHHQNVAQHLAMIAGAVASRLPLLQQSVVPTQAPAPGKN